jgi:hypothetical protein
LGLPPLLLLPGISLEAAYVTCRWRARTLLLLLGWPARLLLLLLLLLLQLLLLAGLHGVWTAVGRGT